MNIINYDTMAIVIIECGNPDKSSDTHYVSIGTNGKETDEELSTYAFKYIIEKYPYAKVKEIVRLNHEEYNKFLVNQLRDYYNI